MSTRQCAFIQARACPVDVDEIPLDVCTLCIDAWKTSAEIQTLTGANLLGPTLLVPAGMPQQVQYVPSVPNQPQMIPQQVAHSMPQSPQASSKPLTLIPTGLPDTSEPAKEAYNMLHSLDNQFINDQISADDYVSMRRSLVDHLSSTRKANGEEESLLVKATQAGYISTDPDEVMLPSESNNDFKIIDLGDNLELLNGYNEPYKRVLPLMLIERNKKGKIGVTKYPTQWKIPSSLNRTNLESIYEMYDQLREDQEKILLQFNGTKMGLLGKKNNRILCMVLDGDEKVEDYTDEIKYLTELLSSTNTIEEFVNALQKAMDKTKDLSI